MLQKRRVFCVKASTQRDSMCRTVDLLELCKPQIEDLLHAAAGDVEMFLAEPLGVHKDAVPRLGDDGEFEAMLRDGDWLLVELEAFEDRTRLR